MFFLRMGERFLLNSFYRKYAQSQKVVFTGHDIKVFSINVLSHNFSSPQRKEDIELALRSYSEHCRTIRDCTNVFMSKRKTGSLTGRIIIENLFIIEYLLQRG